MSCTRVVTCLVGVSTSVADRTSGQIARLVDWADAILDFVANSMADATSNISVSLPVETGHPLIVSSVSSLSPRAGWWIERFCVRILVRHRDVDGVMNGERIQERRRRVKIQQFLSVFSKTECGSRDTETRSSSARVSPY